MLAAVVAAPSFDGGRTAVGIPLIAEGGRDFFPILGGGLQAFANMNPESPYFGVSIFISIGEVR